MSNSSHLSDVWFRTTDLEVVSGEVDLPPSYRVSVGPFDSFEDAERARAELEAAGIEGFVRELEPVVGC